MVSKLEVLKARKLLAQDALDGLTAAVATEEAKQTPQA